MITSAVISPDGNYRYELRRIWGDPQSANLMAIVGANPSTADHLIDDNTIRREIGFAKREGCDGLVKLNVQAWRATNPDDVPAGDVGRGPLNDRYLRQVCMECQVIVCAWGTVADPDAVRIALKIFDEQMATLMCFGVTKSGHPRHPLYLPLNTQLVMWPGVTA